MGKMGPVGEDAADAMGGFMTGIMSGIMSGIMGAIARGNAGRGVGPIIRLLAVAVLVTTGATATAGPHFRGRITDREGEPVVGAMVTLRSGDPFHEVTVFTDADGRYTTPSAAEAAGLSLRVRRIGWRELRVANPQPSAQNGGLDLVLERETDPAAVAAQLPANRWFALVLERIDDPVQREEFKRQCTYCHQQGSAATRIVRSPEEWRKVLALMGRMGGMLSRELRDALPGHFNAAYAPEHAVPALTRDMNTPEFAPAPAAEVRGARIEEWELGGRSSVQHDVMVHPDGHVYSVDMDHDRLYRIDPSAPGAARESFELPRGDMPLGGMLRQVDTPLSPNTHAYVGPHSLQAAPDGAVWITLALGNQLARFDPVDQSWQTHDLKRGYYPHTLRFDQKGRIWYTIAASNHLGMLDPESGKGVELRLPAASLGQSMTLRMLPLILWLGRHVDLRRYAANSEAGIDMPVPYGIDVAPNGGIWFSQLNQHRIGRIDPESFAIEMIDTPFPAPRRLRFDSKGRLWIPSFSGSLLARFDPASRDFRTWPIPIEPLGSDVPYALNVDLETDAVWICGTNSDTLIRFEPESQRFTVFPLPTRVTYTREIDFDSEGGVWTSNSNAPAWQIETGIPRVLRLSPGRRQEMAPDAAGYEAAPPPPIGRTGSRPSHSAAVRATWSKNRPFAPPTSEISTTVPGWASVSR